MESNILLQFIQQELSQIFRRELNAYFSEKSLFTTPPDIDTDHPVDIHETASFTKLAVATIYSLVSQKKIPFFKRPGSKRLYFLKSDLRKWLLEERKKTASEIANDAVEAVKIKKRRG